jgi:two-component sensor histidine kinase/two-component SAPR family response regulator
MSPHEKVNVLIVDDQPAKLLAYEAVLEDLGENLIKASSAREALQHLLKTEVAILLIDVCMPELDGFQLAEMVREHPRFQQTAIIFISAIHLTDVDRLRGYEMGAVDYVPVPIIPEVLRAKVKVFAELYRKTRLLEQLNADLERRVAERTAELEASNARLRESERRRSLALAAGRMGSWDWNVVTGEIAWDAGQYSIFGIEPAGFDLTFDKIRSFIHPEDFTRIQGFVTAGVGESNTFQTEVRVLLPDGKTRWCICAAGMIPDQHGRVMRVSGVTVDVTELKEAEARRTLLVQEVDHRARNALAIVQSIVRMTRARSIEAYVSAVEGRIRALSTAHTLLAESRWEGANLDRLVAEELAPYRSGEAERIVVSGPPVLLKPENAQIIAMVLHELATNAAKYGALSQPGGKVLLNWQWHQGQIDLTWEESGGPPVQTPITNGYGTKVIAASIMQQLGGTATFDWRPQGLRFTMSIAVGDRKRAPQKAAGADRPAGKRRDNGSGIAAEDQHVLLVEDEALVAMMMKDFLSEIGFHVVGPFGKVADAIEAIDQELPQAAILDINLGGELIYPLADELAGRGIPIVFVTGYGAEAIDRRFANVPVLQKPVDSATLQRVLHAAKNAAPSCGGAQSAAAATG